MINEALILRPSFKCYVPINMYPLFPSGILRNFFPIYEIMLVNSFLSGQCENE